MNGPQRFSIPVDGRTLAGWTWLPPKGRRPIAHAWLVHGFPDAPHSWHFVALGLSERGIAAHAPYLPGYGPSDPLARPTLGALATHLRQGWLELGQGAPAAWAGHDWGAAIGYREAADPASPFTRHVLASVPPPLRLLRTFALSPAQLWRSRYMLAFQAPVLPEARLMAAGTPGIAALWQRWSPTFTPPAAALDAVAHALGTRGQWAAALDYYRHLLPRDADAFRADLAALRAPAPRPLTVLFGGQDRCIAPSAFRGVAATLPPGSAVKSIPRAGHFLPLEAPAAFVTELAPG